jgi:hypothetical protein
VAGRRAQKTPDGIPFRVWNFDPSSVFRSAKFGFRVFFTRPLSAATRSSCRPSSAARCSKPPRRTCPAGRTSAISGHTPSSAHRATDNLCTVRSFSFPSIYICCDRTAESFGTMPSGVIAARTASPPRSTKRCVKTRIWQPACLLSIPRARIFHLGATTSPPRRRTGLPAWAGGPFSEDVKCAGGPQACVRIWPIVLWS